MPGPMRQQNEIAAHQLERLAIAVDLEAAATAHDHVEARVAVSFDAESPGRTHFGAAIDGCPHAYGVQQISDDVAV
jgi:hypothetical protein